MIQARYLAPNIITGLALFCGLAAIERALEGEIIHATWFVLYATVLDKLDGFAARKLRAVTEIGRQLDSFADFASFGIAPLFIYLGAIGDQRGLPMLLLGMVYVIGAALRLARFNAGESRSFFNGVPTPLAAGIYSLIVHLAIKHGGSPPDHALLFGGILAGFGLLMNSSWLTYQKIGAEGTAWTKGAMGGLFLFCALLVALRRWPEVLLFVSAGALLVGPWVGVTREERKIRPSRSS